MCSARSKIYILWFRLWFYDCLRSVVFNYFSIASLQKLCLKIAFTYDFSVGKDIMLI